MKKSIESGDLLKSNPLDGYWVCSVTLSYQPKNDEFNAMNHIAITNAVFDHDFELSEVDLDKLSIIYTENYEGHLVPCIEIHSSKLVRGIEVIGQIKTKPLYSQPLEFIIGNGSDGGWPQCGPRSKSLGFQAVHQWRATNDTESWLKDIAEAEKSHKEMLERFKRG